MVQLIMSLLGYQPEKALSLSGIQHMDSKKNQAVLNRRTNHPGGKNLISTDIPKGNEMLNYSVQAMEEIAETTQLSHQDKKYVCELLSKAEKFASPLNGILFEQGRLSSFIEANMMNLPFPITAIEFPRGKENMRIDEKHIVLCMEYASNTNHKYAKLAEIACPDIRVYGGIIVVPLVNYSGNSSFIGWGLSSALFVICKKFVKQSYLDAYTEEDGVKNKLGINIYPFPTNTNHYKLFLNDMEEWVKQAVFVFQHDIHALLHLLVCASCSNTKIIDTPPPGKLNKKRLSKGKLPLPGYRKVVISTYNNKRYLNHNNSPCSGKTPPREHLRRGHIRKYESGMKIWINNTIIGAGRGRDYVGKIYEMQAG